MNEQNNIIYSILSNMPAVDEESLKRILKAIPNTQYSSFEGIFTFCSEYYQKQGVMPDKRYLCINFPQLIFPENLIFHENFVKDFLLYIESEAVSNKSYQLTVQGKFAEAAMLLDNFSNKSKNISECLKIEDVKDKFLLNRKEASKGLKSSIDELDDIIKFYAYRTLNVIVAPSSNFKTTFACTLVYQALMNQQMNVVYLNLEDESINIWYNLLSRHSYEIGKSISVEELKRYLLPDERIPLFSEVVNDWTEKCQGNLAVVSIPEIGSFTPSNINNILLKYKAQWGKIDVVVVDHFNIMNDPVPGMRLQGPELFAYYVRFMTNLSISFDKKGFILIGLSQANREARTVLDKGKNMSTTQIANTSELERSATTVMSLFASDQDRSENHITMKILKNRLGNSGTVIKPSMVPQYAKIGYSINLKQFDVGTLAKPQNFQKIDDKVNELLQ